VENKILIITPPDKIFNQNQSCLLIYPGVEIKKQMQDLLASADTEQNIYIYEQEEDEHDFDWILTVSKMCNTVILDIDNSPYHIKMLSSYLVSLPNTYWLTSEDWLCYNKLSPNRIYSLEKIQDLLGGKVE